MSLIKKLKKIIFNNKKEVKSTGIIVEKYDFQKPTTFEEKEKVQQYYEQLHDEMFNLSRRQKIVNENLQDIQSEYENAIVQRLDIIRKMIEKRESRYDYLNWKIKNENEKNAIIKIALEVRMEIEYFDGYKKELEDMLRDIELKRFALIKLGKNIPKIDVLWNWVTSNEIVSKIRKQKVDESISRMEIKWSEIKAIRDVGEMYINKLESLERTVDEYLLNDEEAQELIIQFLQEKCLEFKEYKNILHKVMKEEAVTEDFDTIGEKEKLIERIIIDCKYINSRFISEEFVKEFILNSENQLKEAKAKLNRIYYDVPMWVKRLREDKNEGLIKELEPEIVKYKEILEVVAGIRRIALYIKNQGIAEIPDDFINKIFYISAYIDEIEQEMNPDGDGYITCFFDNDKEEFANKEELFYLSYIDELIVAIQKQHSTKEDEEAIQDLLSIINVTSGDNNIFSGEDRWKIVALMLLRKSGEEGLNYFFENYRMMLPKDNKKWPLDKEMTQGRRITLKDFLMSYCKFEVTDELKNRAKENVGENRVFERIINLFFKLNIKYAENDNIYGGSILREFFKKSRKAFLNSLEDEAKLYKNNSNCLEVPPEDDMAMVNCKWLSTTIDYWAMNEISCIGEYKNDDGTINLTNDDINWTQRVTTYGKKAEVDEYYKLPKSLKHLILENLYTRYKSPIPYYWNHANKLEIDIETELNRRAREVEKWGTTLLTPTRNSLHTKYVNAIYINSFDLERHYPIIVKKKMSELIAKFALTLEIASEGILNAKKISMQILDNPNAFLMNIQPNEQYNVRSIMEAFLKTIIRQESKRELVVGKYNDGLKKYGYTYGLDMYSDNEEITLSKHMSALMINRFLKILSDYMPDFNKEEVALNFPMIDMDTFMLPISEYGLINFIEEVFPDFKSMQEFLINPFEFKSALFTKDFLQYLESITVSEVSDEIIRDEESEFGECFRAYCRSQYPKYRSQYLGHQFYRSPYPEHHEEIRTDKYLTKEELSKFLKQFQNRIKDLEK